MLIATSNDGSMFEVDDEDYLAVVNEGGWFTTAKGYLAHDYRNKGIRSRVYLHQFIGRLMGIEGPVDHRDLNKRNNKRDNLRPATKQENGYNREANSNNQLQVKGVHWSEERQRFVAAISIDGKQKIIGRYLTLEEATEARRLAVIKYHGEYGR